RIPYTTLFRSKNRHGAGGGAAAAHDSAEPFAGAAGYADVCVGAVALLSWCTRSCAAALLAAVRRFLGSPGSLGRRPGDRRTSRDWTISRHGSGQIEQQDRAL